MLRMLQVAVGVVALVAAGTVAAEDAFYRVPIESLEITEGEWPDGDANWKWRLWWQRDMVIQAYAVLDGEGEAYVSALAYRRGAKVPQEYKAFLTIRSPAGRDVTGQLVWPKAEIVAVKFRVPASKADEDARGPFYRAKLDHYDGLVRRRLPGAAWFRHQAREARKALKLRDEPGGVGPGQRPGRTTELAETYALFSGGRAMSENLQLDRALPEPGESTEMVELDSIKGITVAEIDWEELTSGLDPALDPLAAMIPFDQHAVFFADFNAFLAMVDEVKANSEPVLQVAEPRGEDAGTFRRYERQLCLSISGVSRLLGPRLCKSVAATGSDSYFRTGTDVAFLFEAVDAATLENLLAAQIAVIAGRNPQAKRLKGTIAGVEYRGARSPDRSVCSYLAAIGKTVVVTNSPYQLEQLAKVHQGELKSIAALPEYKFFRDRYRLGDQGETAFVFLSDATIRRWCGPRWRILSSRLTRDMAVIAELQAAHLDRLVTADVRPGPIDTDLPLVSKGELKLMPDGVYSSAVGSLGFMTPIAEMGIDKVTKAEKRAYEQWRDGYERNWTGVFDPIGLRIGVRKDKLSADLTVMPLIGATDYRGLISISRGAKIAPDADVPHEALAHFILAINKDSLTTFERAHRLGPFSRLDWLGEWVVLYFEDDPFWDELAKVPYLERDQFFLENFDRMPVALVAEVESGSKLTRYLTEVRRFIEAMGPGMTEWKSLTYNDEPYVKVTPSAKAKREVEELENWAIYYSASGESLIVTPREDMLKRALDRRIARRKAKEQGKPLPAPARPWLGENVCLQADVKGVPLLAAFFAEDYQLAMQNRAWGNLPILNEWKRLYPGKDPVKLHEELWKIRLIDPAGGRYVWNEQYRTMESTVYGHPGEPKPGPGAPPVLARILGGNFGVTFEREGLRARVELKRKAD